MPVRRLCFVGKECPAFFFMSPEICDLARGAGQTARLVSCGPIRTVAFDAR